MRLILLAICMAYSAAHSSQAQVRPSGPARDRATGPAPSLKKPDEKGGPPPTVMWRYDKARDVTYVNVIIRSPPPAGGEPRGGEGRGPARSLDLTFQLAYKGASTTDLSVAYLIVESGAMTVQGPGLSGVEQVELDADGYRYSYDRISYSTVKGELGRSPGGPAPTEKEVLTFKLPPDDLPRIAHASALGIRLGEDVLTIRSPRLADLRRVLLGGTE